MRHRGALALAAVVLLAGLSVLAPSGPASAHDALLSSSPASGAEIDTLPNRVELTFSGEILPEASATVIEVTCPEGDMIASGPPQVAASTAVQTITSDPHTGLYTVRWKTVSSDGHPISADFLFTLTGAQTPAPTPTPTPSSTPRPTSTPVPKESEAVDAESSEGGRGVPTSGGEMLPVFGLVTGVLILGGSLGVALIAAREHRRRQKRAAQHEGEAPDEQ